MAVTTKEMELVLALNKKLETYRDVYQSQWNEIIRYLAPSYASAHITGEPGTQQAPQ